MKTRTRKRLASISARKERDLAQRNRSLADKQAVEGQLKEKLGRDRSVIDRQEAEITELREQVQQLRQELEKVRKPNRKKEKDEDDEDSGGNR